MRKVLRVAPLVAGMLVLAGCVAGPKYTQPSLPEASAYKELGAPNVTADWKPAAPADATSRGKWWESFHDPELNRLEEQLDASNQNILASAANVAAARALIREAHSRYFPVAGVSPAVTNSRVASAFGQNVGINYSTFSLPLEASWEPDLWGRIRNAARSSAYAAQAAAADLENVRLSEQADLAADYYELRAQDQLKRLLDATLAAYRESFALSQNLYRAGLASDEAVAQAQAQLESTQAQDTSLGVQRAQLEHAIGVLAGQIPSNFSIAAQEGGRLPLPVIPVGLPSQLLERRPDIAAAERAVAAANAQIGIARSAYFPTITLSAAAGFESLSLMNLLAWPSRVWSAGPAVAQTIFDAGLRKATVEQFRASYDQSVANYRQAVLTAFQQVEDNLSALRVLNQVIEQQDAAIEAAARTLREAEVRCRAGIDPYLNVIAAQTSLLSLQEVGVNFRAQQMVASVQLIKALGGGWDAARMPSQKNLALPPAKGGGATPPAR